MANVTQGLFGFDPTQLQQQRENALQQQSVAHASLSPVVAARASMFRAGSQLGDVGASLMGIRDPELEAQSTIQQTAKSLDLKDPAAVRGVAQQWMQSGNATLQNKALKLHEVANQAEEEANQRTKEKAAIDLAERKAQKQAAFSKEYSEAPDADARLAITRKYADMPELIKIDEASQARKEKAAEAATAREEKIVAAKEAQAALFEQQRFLAGEGAKTRAAAAAEGRANRDSAQKVGEDYKVTLAQEKINSANEKQDDLDAKASRSAQGSITHATQMIENIKDAKTLVKFETTGRTGQAAAAINPGGEAGTLRTRIATIKANIGFDRLQKMRDESPTGGALGQVAVQELEALQASIANLSPLQSDAELSKSFDKIVKHYEGWKNSVAEDDMARSKRRAGQQSINLPGATARNPKAGAPVAASTGWGKAVEK
jgi:hypothetical protein